MKKILEKFEKFDYDYYEKLNDSWPPKNAVQLMKDLAIGQEHFREHFLVLVNHQEFMNQFVDYSSVEEFNAFFSFSFRVKESVYDNLESFQSYEFAELFKVFFLKLANRNNKLQEASLQARMLNDNEYFNQYCKEVELIGLMTNEISNESTRYSYLLSNKPLLDNVFKEINKSYGDFSYQTAFGLKILSSSGLSEHVKNIGYGKFIDLLNQPVSVKNKLEHLIECFKIGERLDDSDISFKQNLLSSIIEKSKASSISNPLVSVFDGGTLSNGLMMFVAAILRNDSNLRLDYKIIKYFSHIKEFLNEHKIDLLLHNNFNIHHRVCSFLKVALIEVGEMKKACEFKYDLRMYDICLLFRNNFDGAIPKNPQYESFILEYFNKITTNHKQNVIEIILINLLQDAFKPHSLSSLNNNFNKLMLKTPGYCMDFIIDVGNVTYDSDYKFVVNLLPKFLEHKDVDVLSILSQEKFSELSNENIDAFLKIHDKDSALPSYINLEDRLTFVLEFIKQTRINALNSKQIINISQEMG